MPDTPAVPDHVVGRDVYKAAAAGLPGWNGNPPRPTPVSPLDVKCAECEAPPGTPCRTNYDDQTHQERQRLADLRNLEHGTCNLCGAFMVHGSVLGSPVDAWHPDPAEAAVCPQLPDAAVDWNGYADAVSLGQRPGYPGLEHFTPAGKRRCMHGTILGAEPGPCGCYDGAE